MPSTALYYPHGADFGRFLYACAGTDGNGSVVSVHFTHARLGFDPWQEAFELCALSNDGACARQSSFLSSFTPMLKVTTALASIGDRHSAKMGALRIDRD